MLGLGGQGVVRMGLLGCGIFWRWFVTWALGTCWFSSCLGAASQQPVKSGGAGDKWNGQPSRRELYKDHTPFEQLVARSTLIAENKSYIPLGEREGAPRIGVQNQLKLGSSGMLDLHYTACSCPKNKMLVLNYHIGWFHHPDLRPPCLP